MNLRASESTGIATVNSAGPSARSPARGSARLISAGVAIAFLVYCLVVQKVSGAWSSGFVAYPDEPSHFVGAAMLRDWLVSGHWFAPLDFARAYYAHYPYFAVGYWPPLFSIVTGLWMLVAGVGRVQALFIPAVFAAGTGWLVFRLVRARAGWAAGLCAGAIYMSLPEVRQWVCAVMVDHMTTFLSVAAAACLIRYLRRPDLWTGSLCAVISACAILSKYSAAYLPALPFVAVLFLGRFELLRKLSLLIQPCIVGLMVGPWALWTRKLAFYGLPSVREAVTLKRVASFVAESFTIFPPALMVAVILGLIVLLLQPKSRREDMVVLGLLWAVHVAFLIVSPVGPGELRYVLVPAAALLVMAFAGWSEALALVSHGGRRPRVITVWTPVCVGILTLAFVVSEFRQIARVPQDEIGKVVAFILKDPARVTARIVVPPILEGPVIAEFVAEDRNRHNDTLLRPNKILANRDWFSANYSSSYGNAQDMMEYFRKNPVDLILWNNRPSEPFQAHERILGEMLRQYPLAWRKVSPPDSAGDLAGDKGSLLTIYEYRR